MTQTMKAFWQNRLTKLKETLEKNEFEAFIAQDQTEAKDIVLNEIIPGMGVKTITYGDSRTCIDSGLSEEIKRNPDFEFTSLFALNCSLEEWVEQARQALLVDLFITGSNAITETGALVNLDMVGNRVGGITFGPKYVVVMVGCN